MGQGFKCEGNQGPVTSNQRPETKRGKGTEAQRNKKQNIEHRSTNHKPEARNQKPIGA